MARKEFDMNRVVVFGSELEICKVDFFKFEKSAVHIVSICETSPKQGILITPGIVPLAEKQCKNQEILNTSDNHI